MNKTIFTLLVAMATAMGIGAAEYQYVPLVQEGVKWVYAYTVPSEANEYAPQPTIYYAIELKGDTLIGGEQYKKAYRYFLREHKELDTSTMYPVAYVRETNKKVYGISNEHVDAVAFYNTGIYNRSNVEGKKVDKIDGHDLYLMCDFGDVYRYFEDFEYPYFNSTNGYEESFIEIDGYLRKKYILSELTLIEGVGFDVSIPFVGDWLNPYVELLTCLCDRPMGLAHVENADGKVIYKGRYYDPNVGVDDVLLDFFPADGRYYNLQGMPVAHPEAAPGIYIHNGRKVVVK